MQPDMTISWDQHLKNGNVWKANIELSMQGGDNDEQLFYSVDVYVVAPTQALAQYIICLLYTSPSPRDATLSRMPSSA